ncbi:MAG: hypothetical protein KF906_07430 [Actinobacteria bacterium]|nr:hypothetical protein [Actinomycetota bacterium]
MAAVVAAVSIVAVLSFAVVVLAVVALALVLVGRETARLAHSARPAVFDVGEATDFIADRLSADAQARLSHDDVRWILLADVEALEEATADPTEGRYPWSKAPASPDDVDEQTVDEDDAVARLLARADRTDRDLEDVDVAEVLALRTDYLTAIGAIGGEAGGPGDPEDPSGSRPGGR